MRGVGRCARMDASVVDGRTLAAICWLFIY